MNTSAFVGVADMVVNCMRGEAQLLCYFIRGFAVEPQAHDRKLSGRKFVIKLRTANDTFKFALATEWTWYKFKSTVAVI